MSLLWAIQIIRDTLGRGIRQSVTRIFWLFKTMILMLKEVNSHVIDQDSALKDIFYSEISQFKASNS